MNTHVIPVNKKIKIDKEKCSLVSHETIFKEWKAKEKLEKRRRKWIWWCIFYYFRGWYYRIITFDIRDPFREMKWFWQRGCRGWSDRDSWGAHEHISEVISGMTKHLTKCGGKYAGHPANLKDRKEWETILQKISKAFDLTRKDAYSEHLWKVDSKLAKQCNMQTKEESIKIEEGWHLLHKWFYNLWD